MAISINEIHYADSIQRKASLATLEQDIDCAIREAIRKIEVSCIVFLRYRLNMNEFSDVQDKYKGFFISQEKAIDCKGYVLNFSWTLPTY